MNRVVWSDVALDQVAAIAAYTATFNPRAADRLYSELISLGNSLALFPHRGRPVPGTTQRELVAAYPYVIRYRVEGRMVRVLRVRHAARRPTKP